MNDWRLLREYVNNGSQAAFGQLMEKHMALVYWTCRRDLRDPQLAEDATQNVFLLLARKASGFSPNVSLSGWLFQASRFVSRDLYRSESRRLSHEETIQMREKETLETAESREIDPWLNDSLSALKSADRETILLRYFDGLSIPDVAATLGTSETNARKRLSRALERLRGSLLKKGVGLSTVALASLLAEHPARAVPPALHNTTLIALSRGGIGPAISHFHAPILNKGAYLLMQTAKQKIVATAVAAVVIGALVTVPIAGWKVYHQRAIIAEVGQGGFTDQTAAQSRADPAHDEIASAIRQFADLYNQRNLSQWSQIISPNAIVIGPTGAQVNTGARVIALNQRNLSSHPYTKLYMTLDSLRIQGDLAVSTQETDEREITVAGDVSPAGQLATMKESAEDHWQKIGGKWMIVEIRLFNHVQHGE